MRTDGDIERDVKDELSWQPGLDATDIAVSVKDKDGVVMLTGVVRRYSDKQDAEAAAKRVAGVRGVANDIEVSVPAVDERPDPEIAREAVKPSRAVCRRRGSASRSSSPKAGSRSKARSSGNISDARRSRRYAGYRESRVSAT
jgi:hypothetical protein